jgi:uracil-DNA glycosylase family 4
MAVTSSLNLPLSPKLCKKACKACGLDVFQDPVFDEFKLSNVFWVGLSAVMFDSQEEKLPLSPNTNSGALVQLIETPLKDSFSFYKTNLVKCAPVSNDKIRYPISREMEKCYPNLQWEIEHLKPAIVFLLGKQVANFVFKKLDISLPKLADDFEYTSFRVNHTLYVPIHHPSYILVYKRKLVDAYTSHLRQIMQTYISVATTTKKRKSTLSKCAF